MRVIIAGAGIAGLCTAWQLVKRGHKVTVIEQGPIPNPVSASGEPTAPWTIILMRSARRSGAVRLPLRTARSACSGHGYKFGAAVGGWTAAFCESGDMTALTAKLRAGG